MPDRDPLSQLRDIHLPAEPFWWPPAVGWWLMMVCVLVALFFLIRFIVQRYRHWRSKRQLLILLDAWSSQSGSPKNNHVVMAEVSKLIRRVVILRDKEKIGLCGEDWLRYLDRGTDSVEFSQGPGRILLNGPYQPGVETELQSLLQLVHRWVKRNV